MSSLTDKLSKTMLKQFQKYGQQVTIVQKADGEFDEETSSASVSETSTSTYGLVEPGDDDEKEDVHTGVRKVTLVASQLPKLPVNGDTIGVIDGKTWTVKTCTPTSVSGVPVALVLQVVS